LTENVFLPLLSMMTLSPQFDPALVLASDPCSQFPPIDVFLSVDPSSVCLGHLIVVEGNPREDKVGDSEKELKAIARDNAQVR
jgi:hypothetical protein